jgi:hypothetical protein
LSLDERGGRRIGDILADDVVHEGELLAGGGWGDERIEVVVDYPLTLDLRRTF